MKEAAAQIIIALSFGQGKNNSPGKSNESLAEIASYLAAKYKLPIVAQWEIAGCIPGFSNDGCNFAVLKHRKDGQYLDTYEVLAQAKDYCFKSGKAKAIIVAHPDHAPRCLAVAQKLGFEAVAADTRNVPYDPDSAQEWTKSREEFVKHERLATEYYRQAGYL